VEPRRTILALKTICWLGVVADALWTLALAYPPLYGSLTGQAPFEPELPHRLTMGVGASLMAGWTALLAWTSRDPVSRRAVLLMTACPVILGLIVVVLVGATYGNFSGGWIVGKLVFLGGAMLTGFHLARRMARESTPISE
jgi:hypothetical protein